MYIDQMIGLKNGMRVLHFAPERGLYSAIRSRINPEDYHVRDINPGRFTFAPDAKHLDLCELGDLPSDYYDLIVHSHVLEHVPCNIAYPLFHLHRSLKADGTHVFVVPFMQGAYDECFGEIGDSERIRRFGQNDHVRRFGLQDVDRHLGSLIKINKDYDAAADFAESELIVANIPKETWKGLTAHTILIANKYDMKLLQREAHE